MWRALKTPGILNKYKAGGHHLDANARDNQAQNAPEISNSQN
jgi:hypothetical protein